MNWKSHVQVWMKKGSLEKFLNGVHLEEKEELEIRGCRTLQQERVGRQRRMEEKDKIKTISTERRANFTTP